MNGRLNKRCQVRVRYLFGDPARITNIEPCPEVQDFPGNVITSTFRHPPSTIVLDVTFEGETNSVGGTDNHLFWSVDKQAFVPIGQMEVGESVQTFQGDTKRIASKLARPSLENVYNLEVWGEHVYFVGEQGLLAHNECPVDSFVDAAEKNRLVAEALATDTPSTIIAFLKIRGVRRTFVDYNGKVRNALGRAFGRDDGEGILEDVTKGLFTRFKETLAGEGGLSSGVHAEVGVLLRTLSVLDLTKKQIGQEQFTLTLAKESSLKICKSCLARLPEIASGAGVRFLRIIDEKRGVEGGLEVLLQGDNLLGPNGQTLQQILEGVPSL